MPDFWLSSGFHFLDRDAHGRLVVTDDFLRAYLARPELKPPPEAGAQERALHQALLAEPRAALTEARLVLIEDLDARDNWRVFRGFRDHLLGHPSLEAAYVALFRERTSGIPHLFIDQLTAVVLRNLLEGGDDPLLPRAAELLFRAQKATVHDGSVLLADEETVELHARTGGLGDIGKLLVDSGAPLNVVELDVLGPDNAEGYWARSDRFDTVLDVSFARPGLDALCRVLERWVRHLLGVELSIQPVQAIRDERWVWHVGLDAEASTIMNDLYDGREVEEDRLRRVLSLFRLEFKDAGQMLPRVAGRPVYLAMAMTPDGRLRLKGQNLLVNLPLAPHQS